MLAVTDMSMTWTVRTGWAEVWVADRGAEVTIVASYVSPAPEHFMGAVAHLLLGDVEAGVAFEAEPTVYRWRFTREGDTADVRLTEHPDDRRPGVEIWSTRQSLGALARVTIRCFDAVAQQGEAEYEREWRRPFPRFELEALRTAWRDHRAVTS